MNGTAPRMPAQGVVWRAESEAELREGIEAAFDYRGDVTLLLKNGARVEGYLFDRRSRASLDESQVRLIPAGSTQKLVFRYSDIAGIEFSGRDMAAGKRWQDWVRRYAEKKAAGEKDIRLEPERLD
ncbi:MAG: hypothetical protein N2036_11905 [Bryobacteraceae bacterium]|nr:hypothetical protein [Bryobacteraceae bacterium]MCX7604770.1 hypothetical protein [Bryobacteraceae bacterium]